MGDRDPARLRQLAAELRMEIERVDRTVEELERAREALAVDAPRRLEIYGVAALLETFYTGNERVLARVASTLGDLPTGQAWHRTLLEDATLDIPKVRPRILSLEAARGLEAYLAFRHRFRNLYLFELEITPLRRLVEGAKPAWATARVDVASFVRWLDGLADTLDA